MNAAEPPAPEIQAGPASPAAVPTVEILHAFQDGSRWSTFHRIGYRVQKADGTRVEGEREFLDRGDAVALLPYCPETGHILLTRQFRMPIYLKRPAEAMLLEVCGGILDDPDPRVTLRHEALEELGVELGPAEEVFAAYSTPGSVCEKVTYFVAPYTAAQRRHRGGGLRHEGEDVEVVEMPFAEALRLLRAGEVRDVRTVALLLHLAVWPPADMGAAALEGAR